MDAYERKMMGTSDQKGGDQGGSDKAGDGEQESRMVVEVIKNRSGVRAISYGLKWYN
jgi:hypothetical protein